MHVDRQQKRQRSSTDQGAEMVELPYCEGIQVVGALSASPTEWFRITPQSHTAYGAGGDGNRYPTEPNAPG